MTDRAGSEQTIIVRRRADEHAPSVDDVPDPVFVIDEEGILRFANVAADALLGGASDELIGRSVIELVHPDDLNIAAASLASARTKPVGDIITVRVRTGHGAWRQLELRGWRTDVDGAVWTTVAGRDTSDRHRLGLEDGDAATLASIVANMNSMVAVIEQDGSVRSFNEAVTRLLGHDPDVVRGTPFTRIIHADDRDRVRAATACLGPMDSAKLDARLGAANGDWITCDFTVKNLCGDPAVRAYLVSGEIATSLSDARLRADFLAEHDARTGLLNRDGFLRTAAELPASGLGLGLLIIDIARFRAINELYGAEVGDAILVTVAKRLASICGSDVLAACFGGDEFVLALRSHDETEIARLRNRVVDDLVRPVVVGDFEINLTLRSVVAFDPSPDGLDTLLAETSNELTRSKRYSESDSAEMAIDSVSDRRHRLERLRAAIADGEIQPFFQPIVDIDGVVQSVEALVRWVHPERGVLGVLEFLPLARIAGLAEAIDDQVLDHSLRFATRLVENGHETIEVHVNVDPKLIEREAFSTRFLERCSGRGVDPRRVVLELTENDLLDPGAGTLENLVELRRAGTRVVIDDFGTGFSSLSHLLELPVDGVKIDQSFVAGVGRDTPATNLTRAILSLSESLDLTCVAEGVEKVEQRDLLASNGCRSFQGWLYAPAVHPDEMLALLPVITPATTDT